MIDIQEQRYQIPMNGPPVRSDPNGIRYPAVNTCITVTFVFTDILVGVHLGMSMGVDDTSPAYRELTADAHWITNANIQTYMHDARRLIGPVGRRGRRGTAQGVYILGNILFWRDMPFLHGAWNYLRDGCNRWAGEMGVNCIARYWNDKAANTVNIYVDRSNPPYRFVTYLGGSHDDHFNNEGGVVQSYNLAI